MWNSTLSPPRTCPVIFFFVPVSFYWTSFFTNIWILRCFRLYMSWHTKKNKSTTPRVNNERQFPPQQITRRTFSIYIYNIARLAKIDKNNGDVTCEISFKPTVHTPLVFGVTDGITRKLLENPKNKTVYENKSLSELNYSDIHGPRYTGCVNFCFRNVTRKRNVKKNKRKQS